MVAKILKVVWVLCSVVVLAVTLSSYAPGPASDAGIFLVYGMLILAFPGGFLVAGLFALVVVLQEQLGLPLLDVIDSNYIGFCVMWLAFFIVGYLQWFVLLPRLLRTNTK